MRKQRAVVLDLAGLLSVSSGWVALVKKTKAKLARRVSSTRSRLRRITRRTRKIYI